VSGEARIVKWLEQAGASRIRVNGDEVVCSCPFHTVKSGVQFAMNWKTGLFVCYSCGVTGNVIHFLMNALDWPFERAREAAEVFQSDGPVEALTWVPYDERHQREEDATVKESTLGLYDFCPQYMLDRGFTKKTLRAWEVGYDYASKRVTIPVRNRKGQLVGVSKRATCKDESPYLHLGFEKTRYVYGVHRARGKRVFVNEGQLNPMAHEQLFGRAEAVATMGAYMPRKVKPGNHLQARTLARYYEDVVLAFDDLDNDEAGRRATVRMGDALIEMVSPGHLWVARYYPRGCKDTADMLDGKVLDRHRHRFRDKLEQYDEVRLSLE
jgi:DNA primase